MITPRYFILVLAFFVITGYAQETITCQPSALGQPCSGGGLATAASAEPAINLGVGNPIHLITGNNYQQEVDMPPNASLYGLEIIRHYNSLDPETTALGLGWKLSYDTRLFKVAGRLQVIQADGSRIQFDASGQANTKAHGHMVSQNQQHLWIWANGQTLAFDPYGYLRKIAKPDGRWVDVVRQPKTSVPPHAISQVTNHLGHSLIFDYDSTSGQGRLQAIHTPLGRFGYRVQAMATTLKQGQGHTLLLEAKRPDGMKKHYLYEAALQPVAKHALTGIVVMSADNKASQRTNTWTYDTQGRANSSVHGPPDSQQDKVSLRYIQTPTANQAGLTIVNNAQQQETRFTTQVKNGHYLVSEVSGAPCSGCAAPSTRASYDDKGLLEEINGLQIQRDPQGRLLSLGVKNQGWPALLMHYSSTGQRTQWYSALTGTEQTQYDSQQRPSLRKFANGDSLSYSYDPQGRPTRLQSSNASGTLTTVMTWHGKQLQRIEHPYETETRLYDTQQRVKQRTIHRPSLGQDDALHYTESFEYDTQHRLTRHQLPEGGELRYQWANNGQLLGIQWHDTQNISHSVITTVNGQAGYRYGNNLHLETALNNKRQADGLQLTHQQQIVWSQYQHYDAGGRLQQDDQYFDHTNTALRWRYAYDAQSRLIGTSSDTQTNWYAWNNDGSLAATKTGNITDLPQIQRDASGLPTTVGPYQLRYGPNRRLSQVHRDNNLIAEYRHNAFGYRIFSQSAQQNTQYFYLNNQLVAQAQGGTAISRRYIYAHHVLVGFIDYDRNTNTPAVLYAVHSDLVGAPVLVTDALRTVRWQAHYQATGEAIQVAGDLTLNLRLPGQMYDDTTGWHDNLLRTYVPLWGHYLEPDPLGPLPGQQALGYAAQQPKRFIDPLGLLLFAFDGTRNSPVNTTNVWKLSQYYQDGEVYYNSGPGNPLYIDWDAVTAHNAEQIIANQWQSLLNTLKTTGNLNDTLPIDIIGFSRGAALARHFGNLINQYVDQGLFSYADPVRGLVTACVDLRFMGLFDTVAQFGVAGSQNKLYDLSIAAAWQWVAHAVALNERRVLFPLSAAADAGGNNVIEAPFIGAHSDIGGGVDYSGVGQNGPAGDLSDVALNWMLWQARAATLRFSNIPNDDKIIVNPILHDERAPLLRSVQDSDRRVDAASGALLHHYQDQHSRLGSTQRASVEAVIVRNPNWRLQSGSEVGSVDMGGYARWLQQELGWQALPV